MWRRRPVAAKGFGCASPFRATAGNDYKAMDCFGLTVRAEVEVSHCAY